jgi:hypothetical protein
VAAGKYFKHAHKVFKNKLEVNNPKQEAALNGSME